MNMRLGGLGFEEETKEFQPNRSKSVPPSPSNVKAWDKRF
jgi:hypothetical protein